MPRPEIQIFVCVNERAPNASKPCCAHRNALQVYRCFKDLVRAQGLRDRVLVTRTGCMKHCSQGVTVVVWPHNRWYAGVATGDVDEILKSSTVDGSPALDRLLMPDIPWE